MSQDIVFGIRVGYDGKSLTAGAAANREDIKQIGETAKRSGAEADKALNQTGMSAKALSAAMRGVPAQFTDIFTQLAAGQAPMQVLIQQGGQLKDMFGGIGPAARALGGYVAGMINPFTVTAAAVAGLTFAWYRGHQESDAYTRSLILAGNTAGKTAAQLDEAAQRVARSAGSTQGAAASVLVAAIGAGVPGGSLDAVAESALRMERVVGKATDDTVAEFAKLARDPVSASIKLNEQFNYLTEGTLRQIRAFADQGRAADAAALAIRAYADAIAQRSGDVFESLSKWEKAWLGVKAATSDAGDWVFNLGRPGDALGASVDKYQEKLKILAEWRKKAAAPGMSGMEARLQLPGIEKEVEAARAQMVAERNKVQAANDAAKAKEEENKKRQAGVELTQKEFSLLTAEQKLKAELKEIDNKGELAGWSQEKINALKAAAGRDFNKAMMEARLGAETSTLKEWHDEYQAVIKRALDESRVDYQGYWALVEAGERHMTEEQLRMAAIRRSAALGRGDSPEALRLKGEIEALQARQKTGITAEVERGLAGDMEKAKAAARNAQLDASNADAKALESAASWRRQNLLLVDQEIAAAREKSAADLRERLATLDKNEALRKAGALLEEAKKKATEASAATLTAIEAEIRARYAANDAWDAAGAAARNYLNDIGTVARQQEQAFGASLRSMESVLTKTFETGKVEAADFGNAVRHELASFAAKQAMAPFVQAIPGAIWSLRAQVSGAQAETDAMSAWAALPNAVGNVYRSADLHQYANTVVSQPTFFRFAQGASFGQMGEAGPEAIMPLRRTSSGRLGVEASGASAPQSIRVEVVNPPGRPAEVASATPRFDADGMVVQVVLRDISRGGQISGALQSQFGLNRVAGVC